MKNERFNPEMGRRGKSDARGMLFRALLVLVVLGAVAAHAAEASKPPSHFKQVRGYVGASLSGSLISDLSFFSPSKSSVEAALGLHTGIWIHEFNLDLEIAPFTNLQVGEQVQATFAGTLSVAAVIHGSPPPGDGPAVSRGWPLRIAVGVSAPSIRTIHTQGGDYRLSFQPDVIVEARLLGFVIRSNRIHAEGHVLSPKLVLGPGYVGVTFLKFTIDVLL